MKPHYRVAIFGSSRIKEGDREYRDVYEIARGLAARGYDAVTGGGPGLMQAANAGHRGSIAARDLRDVFLLEEPAGVVDLVSRFHEGRSRSANACVNFDRYRV